MALSAELVFGKGLNREQTTINTLTPKDRPSFPVNLGLFFIAGW